jgi:multidrug efflux pump subunit AcrA (membrane-fusion protein)
MNPTSETANRSITIEALVPNTERLLRPGFFAKGNLVYDPQGDVIVVPEKALTTFAGVTKLFVIANGKAEERVVREERPERVEPRGPRRPHDVNDDRSLRRELHLALVCHAGHQRHPAGRGRS